MTPMNTELYFLLASIAVLALLFIVKSIEVSRGRTIVLPRFRAGCDGILRTVMPLIARKIVWASFSWIVLLVHRIKAAIVEASFGIVRGLHNSLAVVLRELGRRRIARGTGAAVSFHLKHIEGPRKVDNGV